MKKKTLKIFLSILITLILLVIGFIILIVTEVIPNPFLDTKDLVCSRSYIINEDSSLIENVTFEFDKKAFVKNVNYQNIIKFKEVEMAEEYYNEMSNNSLVNFYLDGTNVIETSSNQNIHSDKLKQQIKKYYEEELAFKCE